MKLRIFLSLLVGLLSLVLVHRLDLGTPGSEIKATIRFLPSPSPHDFLSLVSEVKKVTSFEVLERVFAKTNLRPLFKGTRRSSEDLEELQQLIFVEMIKDSDLVDIYARIKDPRMAQRVINATVQEFVGLRKEEASKVHRELQALLGDRISRVKNEMDKLEEEMTEIEPRDYGKSRNYRLYLDDEIKRLNEEKKKLREIFTLQHPDVVKLDEELASLNAERGRLPEHARFSEIELSLQEKERLYEELFTQIQESKLKEAQTTSDVQIIKLAHYDSSKKGVRQAFWMGFCFLIGFFLIWALYPWVQKNLLNPSAK